MNCWTKLTPHPVSPLHGTGELLPSPLVGEGASRADEGETAQAASTSKMPVE